MTTDELFPAESVQMDSELLKRIRSLAANDEGISAEGTRRLLAAYDELARNAQIQSAANDLNREDLEELQNRMAKAESRVEWIIATKGNARVCRYAGGWFVSWRWSDDRTDSHLSYGQAIDAAMARWPMPALDKEKTQP